MTHSDLSDEQAHILIELYGQTPSALDELPYPDYSYPTWSLPRLPIPPILVSWGSKFGGYE
jgi:hypothetical protein